MLYIIAIITTVFIGNTVVQSSECRTVKEGSHYPSPMPIHGFKSATQMSSLVQFTNSSASYAFPASEPNFARCTSSWNKLWGACRCGYLTSNHQDSDRFVFRHAMNCLDDKTNNCSRLDLIEIAAYAYDNGVAPIDDPTRLLKEFSTKLLINNWYKITMIFEENKTTYLLYDNNGQHLETQEIDHRSCSNFNLGIMQGLYFGGVCPAPQDVTVCYDTAQ
jgi:hypothetical protein